MPMPWKPSKRKGTMPSATATDPVARMESMLLGPLKAKPDEPVPPMPWRGKRSRGGGYAALMPTIDEFFGTSNQVCGGFWPFGTDMALPAEGVPVGRSLMTGAGVCCDPISWFKAGIIKQPSMFLLGLPAIGKSMSFRLVGITPEGRRILRFDHDRTRRHSPIIDRMGEIYIVENKSLAAYLRQLENMGEDADDYASIWNYTHGETEPRFGLYVYPDFPFGVTGRVSNLELE